MSKFKPSRILNEPNSIMGLKTWDICALVYFLMISYRVLQHFNLELFSFIITAFLTIALIHIRLTKRQKFLRDLAKSVYWRFRL